MDWERQWDEAVRNGETQLRGLDDAAAAAIAERLASDTTLTVLYLHYNQIGDVGASKIGESLVTNTTLTILNLSSNQIGDVGSSKIGESLTNTSLTELNLDDNQIGDIGALKLAIGLSKNTKLEVLSLNQNKITMLGIDCLAKAAFTRGKDGKFDFYSPHQAQRNFGAWVCMQSRSVWTFGAGKTTLCKTLRVRGNEFFGGWRPFKQERSLEDVISVEKRTIGFETTLVQTSKRVQLQVYDLGGHEEFHALHDRIMGDANTVFILLANLSSDTIGQDGALISHQPPFEREWPDLQYWLDHIISHFSSDEISLQSKANIVLVGSRGIGADRVELAQRLFEQSQSHVGQNADVGTEMLCIDSPLTQSEGVTVFWKHLQSLAFQMCQKHQIPELCNSILKLSPPTLFPDQHIVRWSDFSTTCCRKLHPQRIEDEQLRLACEYLNHLGAIVYFKVEGLNQFVILDPTWFGQTVGEMLKPHFFRNMKGVNIDHGVADLDHLHQKLFGGALTRDECANLLQRMELCYRFEDPRDNRTKLMFPTHLRSEPPHLPPDFGKLEEAQTAILFARRIQLTAGAGRMSHGTFPRLQVRLYAHFAGKVQCWRRSVSVKHAMAAAFLRVDVLASHIDIAVWGQQQDVFALYQLLMEQINMDTSLIGRYHELVISPKLTFAHEWPVQFACAESQLRYLLAKKENEGDTNPKFDWSDVLPHGYPNSHAPLQERLLGVLNGWYAWSNEQLGVTQEELERKLQEIAHQQD